MGEIEVEKLVIGIVQTNCYIISNRITKEAVIIDPADKQEGIKDFVDEKSLKVVGIFLTHGHFDHILAAEFLAKACQTKIYASISEKELLADPYLNCSAPYGTKVTLAPDVWLKDGEEIELAGVRFRAIHTPGHTAGGNCYYLEEQKILFSGDTLFEGTIGRCDLPTGNIDTLILSIKEKLLALEDETKVFPGHGDSTSIGNEKKHNPYLNGGV